MVDRLERRGHVRRRRDGPDRRRMTLHLDDAGDRLGRRWFGRWDAASTRSSTPTTPTSTALLTGFLERVTATVAEHRRGAALDPTEPGPADPG